MASKPNRSPPKTANRYREIACRLSERGLDQAPMTM
jgi:hypothetical protein